MKKILLSLLLLLPLSVHAYTSPGAPIGFVNDFAGMISPRAATALESELVAYEKETGAEITVVTIPALGNETIETYAVRLFKEWGIGKKGANTGVLLLVSRDDKKIKIETGYGAEGALTDVESKQIIASITTPYFQAGDFDAGITETIRAMIQAADGQFEAVASSNTNGNGSGLLDAFFWIVIFGIMWLGSVLSRSRSWWAGGVIGAIAGGVVWFINGMWLLIPILAVLGLGFDYLVSTKYKKMFQHENGTHRSILPWLFLIGGRPGRWDRKGPFDGFGGGFGGGSSGGGGASGSW